MNLNDFETIDSKSYNNILVKPHILSKHASRRVLKSLLTLFNVIGWAGVASGVLFFLLALVWRPRTA